MGTHIAISGRWQNISSPPGKLSSKDKGSEAEQQQILQELKNVGTTHLNKFFAGNLKQIYLNWQSVTNDNIILGIIRNGLKINFKEKLRNICIEKIQHSKKEKEIINSEVKKLLDNEVIVQCDREIMALFLQFLQEKRKMTPLEISRNFL